mgnify:CR=1 FL=1
MEHVTLDTGAAMPMIGYGVYQIKPRDTQRCVSQAIQAGYRSIDTAQYYNNEDGVGRAVAASGIPRSDFFLTTKVAVGGYHAASRSIEESLRRLRTDYVDLLLIHWPTGRDTDTWRALEEAHTARRAKAIGLSNFYGHEFTAIADRGEIVPSVNQLETHVFRQQGRARELMARYGTQLESWGPFGEGRNGMFTHPVLTAIGHAHGKTVAQVILRFLTQTGTVAIPKTTHPARMAENLSTFDFTLNPDDLTQIKSLDTDTSLFGWW